MGLDTSTCPWARWRGGFKRGRYLFWAAVDEVALFDFFFSVVYIAFWDYVLLNLSCFLFVFLVADVLKCSVFGFVTQQSASSPSHLVVGILPIWIAKNWGKHRFSAAGRSCRTAMVFELRSDVFCWLQSRTARFARYADERNVGCVYHRKVLFNQETNHIYRVRGSRNRSLLSRRCSIYKAN